MQHGKVTVKAPGKTTITVKAAATDTYKAATKNNHNYCCTEETEDCSEQ